MPRISNTHIIHQLEQPALSIRSMVPLEDIFSLITDHYRKITDYLMQIDESITSVPLVIYHDYRNMGEKTIDMEVVFPVTKNLPGNELVKSMKIPENRLAFGMFLGTQEDMEKFYDELENWILLNNFRIVGPAYEYYYNGYEFGSDYLLTKIAIPILPNIY